jgi:hypothetical protein
MRRAGLPDLGDVLFLLIVGLLLFSRPAYLFSDGSTGWHLVVGRWVLQHGDVPRADFLSYTAAGMPWVAFEWLAEVVLATLERLGGLALVAVGCASAIAALFLLLHREMQARGCRGGVAFALAAIGAVASSVHWLARPHLFTFFAVYAISCILDAHWRSRLGARGLVCASTALMLVWANLHPAFPLGVALIGIFYTCAVAAGKPARALGAALALGTSATLVNPYGWKLHDYVIRHLADPVLGATQEFLAPTLNGGLQANCFFALLAILLGALVPRWRRASLPEIVVALGMACLALRSVRHVPLFVVVALPLLGQLLATSRTIVASKNPPMPMAAVVVLAVIAIAGGPLRQATLAGCDFDPATFPTTTLAWIRRYQPPADRGLAWDNWGGFLAYRLSIPVFIDDRSDFFPRELTRDYLRIDAATPASEALLDRYGIQWVLFPRPAPLIRLLAGSPKWQNVSEDAAAALFVRR